MFGVKATQKDLELNLDCRVCDDVGIYSCSGSSIESAEGGGVQIWRYTNMYFIEKVVKGVAEQCRARVII